MRKYIYSILFITGFISTVMGQDGYRGGFIIDNNGQYIYGYIRLNPLNYFNACEFKESLEGTSNTYTPEDIKGYGFIPGDSYISFKTDKNQWRFLLVVKKDKITLFRSDNEFFIQKGDLPIHELSHTDKIYNNNTLIGIIEDCPYLKKRIKSIDVTEKRLLELIEQYNECIEIGSEYYQGKSQLALVFGTAPSSVKFYPAKSEVSYLSGDDFKTSMSKAGGLIFSHKLQTLIKFKSSIGAYLGVFYIDNMYHRINSTKDPTNSKIIHQSDIKINTQEVVLPIGVQFTYEGKLKPYIKTGFLIQPWSITSSSGSLYTISGNDIYFDTPLLIDNIKFTPKFQIAFGLSKRLFQNKRILFELSLSKGKANSTASPYKLDTEVQQHQILFGLIF